MDQQMPNFEHISSELYRYVYERDYQPDISAMQLEGLLFEIQDLQKDLKFRDKLVEIKQQLLDVLEI